MSENSKPIVRLKPKTSDLPIKRGYPWVYDNELVLDRRTKSIDSGSIVQVQSSDRTPLATAAFNANSKITLRILDLNPLQNIDLGWMTSKMTAAFDLRERLFDQPFYRLIHAEADGLPGVIIDRFGDICVVQPNAAWADREFELICEALDNVIPLDTIIKNTSGRARKLEGLDAESSLFKGHWPQVPIPVPMNGAIYMADLANGQKTGLFFDQRPNHAFGARLAKGARVLDVFSHVGGFGLAALAAGASSAVAVDGSEAALTLARQGAAAMGLEDRFLTRRGDAFDVLSALADEGAQFDVVICDPPAFAASKKALDAGLRAYEKLARMAAPLVKEGGYLGLCSCSHAADLDKFRAASLRGLSRAGRASRLIHTGFAGPDHPIHPQLAESGYLKALFFRL
ncbi:MAG: RSP_2647 family RNA methyltransferase [Paracoccaceae bacterium]